MYVWFSLLCHEESILFVLSNRLLSHVLSVKDTPTRLLLHKYVKWLRDFEGLL